MLADELLTDQLTIHKRAMRLMGNRFEISVITPDAGHAEKCIDAAVSEITRIEKLLTTFSEDSQTNLINRNAGLQPVKVDAEVFQLVARSLKISSLTQGAFDITYGSIDKSLWNFDVTMTALPDAETARKAVRLINYHNVILNSANCTIFLKEKGMRIGFGGIGKGYAADRAKMILKQMGINSGVVNASGDLTAWGIQPNGQKWRIGVADPDQRGQLLAHMNITDLSVATSGNYEKYVEIAGKRYSHTIDPRTGLPVSGIKSVTIITTSAEIADALATPVTIMGVYAGLDMINQINDVEAIVIDDNNRVYTSKNITLN